MTGTFAQEFCSVAPCGAGGRIVTGSRLRNCLVQVADGQLTVTQAPAIPVLNIPAAGIRIVTPPTLRKIGTGVIVQTGDQLLAVEFDTVYRRQQDYDRQQAEAAKPAIVRWLSAVARVFSLSDITSLRRSIRLARRLTGEFTAALLAYGAVSAT
jgi:hypothetical protein